MEMIKKLIAWIILAPVIAATVAIIVMYWQAVILLVTLLAVLALISWACDEVLS